MLEWKPVGSKQRGRPRIGWLNDACNNMKVLKVRSRKELELKRRGTTWLRKPKPLKGCKSNGRRRRRRRKRLLRGYYIYV